MIPSCSHTGTPLHFHSSTTSGSAFFTRARSWLSILPRQSPSSLIFAAISLEGDPVFADGVFPDLLFGVTLFFFTPSPLISRQPRTPATDYRVDPRCGHT